MKKFLKENWFKLTSLSLFLIIIVGFSVYYFGFFLPQQKATELAQQQLQAKLAEEANQKVDEQKALLQDCLNKADSDYSNKVSGIDSSIKQLQSQIDKLNTETQNFNHVLLNITSANAQNQDSYTTRGDLNSYNSTMQSFTTQQNSKINVLQGKITSFNSEKETASNNKNSAHDDCYKQFSQN